MSYYRFAEIAIALCFGLTFAIVGWWEIAEPIWREESSGSAEAGSRFGNPYRLCNPRGRTLWCL
jgi:hypothetical protein